MPVVLAEPVADEASLITTRRIKDALWPRVDFYDKQWEMIDSAENNSQTYVYAGNGLGKDFVIAFIVLATFLKSLKLGKTCRILTTSVKEEHLDVMWGEIGRFIMTAEYPLLANKGGPLVVNNLEIRRASEQDSKNPLSYLKGMVAGQNMDAFAGHHAEVTLGVGDEGSGLDDLVLNKMQGWAKRLMFIGNPNPCNNFYYRNIKGGDLPRNDGSGTFFRKVIRIRALDSPSVRYSLAQKRAGLKVTDEEIVPGVITYGKYLEALATWDELKLYAGIHAEFYEGASLRLFPVDWLNEAEGRAAMLPKMRKAKGGGCDPAEGGDKTALAAVDEYGLIALEVHKTPNTDDVVNLAIDFIKRWEIPPDRFVFDRGGGGKQHADRMYAMRSAAGNRLFPVRSVGFGESITLPVKYGIHNVPTRREVSEERYEYKNRRAQMYGELSEAMDPGLPGLRFAIPAVYSELRRQLSFMPKRFDQEGRMFMIPKQNPKDPDDPETLIKLIGHSPDEADAVALAYHGMRHKGTTVTIGVV